MRALLALVLLLVPALAFADDDPLRMARSNFEYGKYEEAISLIDDLNARKQLADGPDLLEAWRIHGLSHFYLGHRDEARSSFVRLLSIEPDHELDPLLVPPSAVVEFERVKTENAALLDPIRERRKAIERQRQLEEADRKRLLEEERKRRERESSTVLLQRGERHSFLTTFLPFGMPQLEQGRGEVGILFAATEGVCIAGSVLAYSQVQGYIGSDRKVPPENLSAARNWQIANWIFFGASVALYVGGVIDAVLHYEEETVTTLAVPRDSVTPTAPRPGDPPPLGLFLTPTEGGAAAGVVGRF